MVWLLHMLCLKYTVQLKGEGFARKLAYDGQKLLLIVVMMLK